MSVVPELRILCKTTKQKNFQYLYCFNLFLLIGETLNPCKVLLLAVSGWQEDTSGLETPCGKNYLFIYFDCGFYLPLLHVVFKVQASQRFTPWVMCFCLFL